MAEFVCTPVLNGFSTNTVLMTLPRWDGIMRVPLRKKRNYVKAQKVCSCFQETGITITDEERERIRKEIDKAIADGVRVFLFGYLGEFCDFIYDILTEKKALAPQLGIERLMCLQLTDYARKPSRLFKKKENENKSEWQIVSDEAIEAFYQALDCRNRVMIDKSDLVFIYSKEADDAGAYKAYKYAKRKRKKMINFALN